ncbi:MAG: hypothetical protein UY16_C0004G0007 [Candidatus Gottesmanbacteria bacterium GW2011_GWA2_47_9]|uniref:Uncharacterized protein n=2 Tax=Candidatus Gottesmaniibacteriota TaxID=1752720 RepID=A0A0G1X0S4_9BACT|nr:MAG: hypothetical protein UY16_C0004G0007 [Candidatus Gottesmanbacteria bacterium GW2011_GWA2_47_9]KKU96148.1 MAG: hypothetical protein UY27_C0003G0011 [Candidatus Gottesmanbacteria bacterium GW2011_GWA1_48_13]
MNNSGIVHDPHFSADFMIDRGPFGQKCRDPVFKIAVFEKREHFLRIGSIGNFSGVNFVHEYFHIFI